MYGGQRKYNYYVTNKLFILFNRNKYKYKDNPISASERRILITQWVGEAVDSISPDTIQHFFEKTGCLITANGLHDKSIFLLFNYNKFQAILFYNY